MPIRGGYDELWDVLVQDDGKILAVGAIEVTYGHKDYGLVRYNADGSLDTSFGNEGVALTDLGTNDDYPYAAALQADGKIVVVGMIYTPNAIRDVAFVRYNSDGSLDQSFGGNGIVIRDLNGSTAAEALHHLVLEADGDILAAGTSNDDMLVLRYRSDGSPDGTFGSDGAVFTDFAGGFDSSTGIALQADGMIVVSGIAHNGSDLDFAVARYSSDGYWQGGACDTDGDGVLDGADNCPLTANLGQEDNDGDGQGDACDDDDDNDGVDDANDAFPFDSSETNDSDGDGVGDNSDAFPDDPSESVDSDGDGVGDNGDADDDGDDQSDADETACGSDPLDAGSTSPDNDGDGSPDCVDADDDNDGLPDGDDPDPLNARPDVMADDATIAVDEGQDVTNSGTVSDPEGDPLTLTASVGTIVDNEDGTWSWSYAAGDGPDEGQTVTITAEDAGGSREATFELVVNNVTPTVDADNATVTADEGRTAANSGTYGDPGDDTVTLMTSVGTIVDNGNGTWSWSFDSTDGPDDSQTVTITATDSDGAAISTTFALVVNNAAPTATFGNDGPVDEGSSFTMTLSETSDPSSADTAAGFEYAFDCSDGNGYSAFGDDSSATCATNDNAVREVRGQIRDVDGGITEYMASVTVNNVAPAVSLTGADTANEGDTVRYSYTVGDPGTADTFSLISKSCGVGGVLSNSTFDPNTGAGGFDCSFPDGPATTTVSVTVSDDDGGSGSDSLTVAVSNVAPSVGAGGDQTEYEDVEIHLDPATFGDPGVDTHSATIDWGDGSVEDGTVNQEADTVIGSHTYADPGVYTVTVTVTDEDGASSIDTLSVTVVHGFIGYCVYANSNEVQVEEAATVACSVRSEEKIVELKKESQVSGDAVSRIDEVKIGEGAEVGGNVIADRKVELHKEAVVNQNVTSGGDIDLEEDATIVGDATAAGSVKLGSGATVGGTITEGADVEPVPPIAQVSVGVSATGDDVKVEKNETLTLEPGAYGKLEIKEGATLNLSAGNYTFEEFGVEKNAAINLDVSGGPIVIQVEKHVDMHEGVVMASNGPASDILFQIAGNRVQLHNEGTYLGTYIAPQAHIDVHEGATVTGALYGENVQIKKGATVIANPALELFIDLFVNP
jgi:uncharacterized delta-60 repeat protein